MPVSPHLVTFTVYDTDGTTLKNGAVCLVRNCTKKSTSATTTTNVNGVGIIDLANLPITTGQTVPYATGDICLLISYNSARKTHVGAYYKVTGDSKDQTLYLRDVGFRCDLSNERIMTVNAVNANASTTYHFKFWSFDDGELQCYGIVPVKNTVNIHFAGRGLMKSILEIENKDVYVTVDYK